MPQSTRSCLHRANPDSPTDRLASVTSRCRSRGLRLTPLRRQVLELLLADPRPQGAYSLIDALAKQSARTVNPPSVYRALQFLMVHGFVAKIESENAFVACSHPEQRQDCLFFVCDDCGSLAELTDSEVGQLLAKNADSLGFEMTRPIVEIKGTCEDCLSTLIN